MEAAGPCEMCGYGPRGVSIWPTAVRRVLRNSSGSTRWIFAARSTVMILVMLLRKLYPPTRLIPNVSMTSAMSPYSARTSDTFVSRLITSFGFESSVPLASIVSLTFRGTATLCLICHGPCTPWQIESIATATRRTQMDHAWPTGRDITALAVDEIRQGRCGAVLKDKGCLDVSHLGKCREPGNGDLAQMVRVLDHHMTQEIVRT